MDVDLKIQENEAQLFDAAARHIIKLARAAVKARGAFHLALSGGRTPQGLYQRLRATPYAEQLPWEQTHVYFGDERCVPPDDAQSNFRMAREALLEGVELPPEQIHRIHGEQDPESAAAHYAQTLARHVPNDPHSGLPRFDLMLLGMGPDGHIASLFPCTAALEEQHRTVVALYVPKLSAWRITLTLPVLNQARHLMLLVSGEKKADVLRHVLQDIHNATPLPIQYLRPRGRFEWFIDKAAARYLREPPVSSSART